MHGVRGQVKSFCRISPACRKSSVPAGPPQDERRCAGPVTRARLWAVLISAKCENACGKLPTSRFALRIVLLGQQPDIVAQSQQPLEQSSAPRHSAPAAHRLSASQKLHARNAPSPRRQSVRAGNGVVAQHEAVAEQPPLDRRYGAATRGSDGRQEADHRNHQQAGIQRRPIHRIGRSVLPRIEPVAGTPGHGCGRAPRANAPAAPSRPNLLRRADRAVERHPRHHLGMGEMPPAAAHLPDAVIGLVPNGFQMLDQRDLERPARRLGRRCRPARRRYEASSTSP